MIIIILRVGLSIYKITAWATPAPKSATTSLRLRLLQSYPAATANLCEKMYLRGPNTGVIVCFSH